MKKICSMMTMLAMMVAVLSFTACGGSDDDEFDSWSEPSTKHSLIGTWDAVSSRFYNDKGWEKTEKETGYWVFTETTVTDHFGENDLLDGQTLNYTFDGKKLKIGGVIIWEVVKFSGNSMVLKAKIIEGYQETTFKKR